MVKILIVDDDKIICNNIKKYLENNLKMPCIVTSAYDGEAAIEIVEKKKVDIIISDVVMRKIDGIALGKFLKSIDYQGDVIYISGNADKQILSQIIKLKAMTFLEKPLNPYELLETIEQSVMLRQERINKQQQSMLLTSHFDSVKENICKKILSLSYNESELEMINMNFVKAREYLILKFCISTVGIKDCNMTLNNFLAYLSTFCGNYFYCRDNDVLTIICSNLFHFNNMQIAEFVENYTNTLEDGIICTTAISNRFLHVKDSGVCNNSLEEVTKSKYFSRKSCVLFDGYATEIALDKINVYWENFDKYIIDKTILIKFEEVITFLNNIVNADNHQYILNISDTIRTVEYIVHQFLTRCFSLFDSAEYDYHTFVINNIYKANNYYVLCENMYKLIYDYLGFIEENSNMNYYCKKALDYIEVNIEKVITLNDVADYCNVTPTYLNKLFKGNRNQGVIQYANRQKLKRAKYFVEKTDMSMSEIADRLSFYDSNHFIKVFKKEFNITPAKLRAEQFLKN